MRLFPPIQIGGCGVGFGFALCPRAVNVVPWWANSSSLQTPRITSMASSKSALRCSKSTPSAWYSPRMYPVATASVKRPSESASRVAAVLATRNGLR